MSLIPASVATRFSSQILAAQKNAPQILFAGGIVGSITSTVLACKATLKLEEIVDEAQENLDKRRAFVGQVETRSGETYSEKHLQADTLRIYIVTAAKISKEYAPALVVGGLAIAALTKSHNIQAERIAGLSAAYSALDKAYRRYRERVVEELGEEKDREFRYGKEVQEVKHTDEDGKTKKKKVTHFSEDGPSMYARIFNERNRNFVNNNPNNIAFIRGIQAQCNYQLQTRGHVFLNDVYDALGMERSQAGAVVGWIKGEGEDHIDFGCWDDSSMDRFHAFCVGEENELLLDFNVQGTMWNRIS